MGKLTTDEKRSEFSSSRKTAMVVSIYTMAAALVLTTIGIVFNATVGDKPIDGLVGFAALSAGALTHVIQKYFDVRKDEVHKEEQDRVEQQKEGKE